MFYCFLSLVFSGDCDLRELHVLTRSFPTRRSSDLSPPRSARAQIASGLNCVGQVERAADGRRRVVSISELTGMEGDVITMQEIFRFKRTGIDSEDRVQGDRKSVV